MLRTNLNELVEMSVVGEISHPPIWGYRVGADGQARFLPGVGGIAYNVKVGMSAVHWKADHVEPGVSCTNFTKQFDGSGPGFAILSQIGNRARVITGDAKGAVGMVTGKHGGVEHVMIDFDDAALDKLVPGDKVLVRGFGLGLQLTDFPNVTAMNIDPALLGKLRLRNRDGRLTVPVALELPAAAMGSGLGSYHAYSGDYDVQLFDPESVREFGLDAMRLGDLVAITDADSKFGRSYRRGHVVIGIVVHSCSTVAGHGPGVTTLFTGKNEDLGFEISRDANLAQMLGIGSARKRRKAKAS